MLNHKYSIFFTSAGLVICFITNFILIYITLFHSKRIYGTYKLMVVMFSALGFLFSVSEFIARPFTLNYNRAVILFSINDWIPSKNFLSIALSFWITFYLLIISFVGVQFVYRYLYILHSTKLWYFDGVGRTLWISYLLIPTIIYSVAFNQIFTPTDASDDYLREVIRKNFDFEISTVARYIMMPYNENNTIQWRALSLLISAGILICFQYFIVVFFGLKIYFNMKLRLKSFSVCQEKFQSQLFRALVAQTIGPTIFLILPSAPFFVTTLLSPYTNMEINWQTGWLCSFFELYPISDNIAFILIVSEYRNYIKSKLVCKTRRELGSKISIRAT